MTNVSPPLDFASLNVAVAGHSWAVELLTVEDYRSCLTELVEFLDVHLPDVRMRPCWIRHIFDWREVAALYELHRERNSPETSLDFDDRVARFLSHPTYQAHINHQATCTGDIRFPVAPAERS